MDPTTWKTADLEKILSGDMAIRERKNQPLRVSIKLMYKGNVVFYRQYDETDATPQGKIGIFLGKFMGMGKFLEVTNKFDTAGALRIYITSNLKHFFPILCKERVIILIINVLLNLEHGCMSSLPHLVFQWLPSALSRWWDTYPPQLNEETTGVFYIGA